MPPLSERWRCRCRRRCPVRYCWIFFELILIVLKMVIRRDMITTVSSFQYTVVVPSYRTTRSAYNSASSCCWDSRQLPPRTKRSTNNIFTDSSRRSSPSILRESATEDSETSTSSPQQSVTEKDIEEEEGVGTTKSIRVGIVGAGAIAYATAAILSKNGHDPMIWSPSSSSSTSIERSVTRSQQQHRTAAENDEDAADGGTNDSFVSCTATNCKVANGNNNGDDRQFDYDFQSRLAISANELVEQNDVLIIAIPANGHKAVMDSLVPSLLQKVSSLSQSMKKERRREEENSLFHVIISSHSSLGALYLSQQFYINKRMTAGDDEGLLNIAITAWGTTICTARKPAAAAPSPRSLASTSTSSSSSSSPSPSPSSPSSNRYHYHHQVDIKTVRNSVDLCTIPQQKSSEGLRMCRHLFPDTDFRSRDGLLAISLSNVNPQNHLGMALGNISRMDKNENWFQFQNTTPKIGSLLEALDRERLDIADALGVQVKTLQEHFALSFHVPITGSVSDMSQEIHRRGNDVNGPNDPDSRYILEDVPFGLTLTVALGKLVNRPATLHEAGLKLCSAMYGRDFEAENDLLTALGLLGCDSGDKIDLKDLQEAAGQENFLVDSEVKRAVGIIGGFSTSEYSLAIIIITSSEFCFSQRRWDMTLECHPLCNPA
eukprot:CAMPEP_0113468866 /NCGR_PEP_ID=MMETSP0014_2-20120614/15588_1 /TAXON_ID=2857 /ORGANISM="Nitzschia sp." /LENGTH=659 /DNA_ID=CAMNT_0000361293 /DNA_START=86 /DNA_END=2066 /DNA_ORIENTATION=+ /assembly_acc=CAM_ASM_000159